jgi:peptide/nickel transport system substrate-binding protein
VISSKKNRLVAVLLGAAFIAAGCGSSAKKATTPTTAAPKSGDTTTTAATKAPVTTAAPVVAKGGTLTIGAEQEPDCADSMNTCGGSSWGYWMMNVTTLPRLYITEKEGDNWVLKPTDLVDGEPKVESSPKQKVTIKLSKKGVWSTGDPITSADLKYTYEQIAGPDAKDVYDASGYDKIESVETPDAQTFVMTFKEPYADWKNLFGAGYGFVPSKILSGKDRNAEMKDGYAWSGGPWKIEKWEKGVGITLIPNDKYWGTKPALDKVVFKFVADTSAEFQAYKAGEVSVIYPQPQIAVVDAIKAGIEGNSSFTGDTGNVEALWINNSKAPFDVLEVRQALAYAIDRDAVVDRLFGPLGVKKAVQSFNPPIVSKYAGTDFAIYKKDLKKVDELMVKAGYAKGADGVYAKGGAKASFALRTTAGNKRRELTQEVLQAQLKEAGCEMTVDNAKAGDLFGKIAPGGDYQVALYAQVATSPTPGLSTIFLSTNIPSEANKNSGQNWQRVNVPAADPLLKQVDVETDDAKRVIASKAADKILADNAASIPLDPLPNIFLWSKKVNGPKDNPVMGPFWTMNTWTLS